MKHTIKFNWKNLLWLFSLPYFYGWFQFEIARGFGILMYMVLFFALGAQLHFFNKYSKDVICNSDNGIKLFITRISWISFVSLIIQISFFQTIVAFPAWPHYLIALGRFSVIFVSVFCTHHFLLEKTWSYEKKSRVWWHIIIYALPSLIIFSVVWLAFYPANMSPDSITVWRMAVENGPYNSLHPLLYTMMTKLLSFLWGSPAIIVLFQIILSSTITAYIAWRFDSWRLHPILCVAFAFICPLIPTNLMYTVTIWKDVPYTLGLLLLMVEVVRTFLDNDYYKKWWNVLGLGVLLFFIMSLRHNGSVVAIITMFILASYWLVRKHKKKAIITVAVIISALVVFLSVSSIIKFALGDNYEKTEGSVVLFAVPIQGLITVNNDVGDQLTLEEQQIMDKYIDYDGLQYHMNKFRGDYWRYYARAFDTANSDAILDNKLDFIRDYIKIAKKYPKIVFRSYTTQTSLIWSSRKGHYVSNIAWTYQDSNMPETLQRSVLPNLKEWLFENLGRQTEGYKEIFWLPAIAFLGMLILLGVAWHRWKLGALVVFSPVLFNAITHLISMEAQDTRYIYVNFSALLIFLMFALMKKKDNPQSSEIKIPPPTVNLTD
ncbi:MAG: hypothetical protein KAQ68_05825 [Clostridiales bacterium]|nr:hypothetical protein [Clostridiales bacterium]